MLEQRLRFLVVYVGSAAMVAFLAACLSTAHVATFGCQTSGVNGVERCERPATLAASGQEADVVNSEYIAPDELSLESVAMAASH
jgi:hypothetical protein